MSEQFDNDYAEHHAAPKLIDLAEHNAMPKPSVAAAPVAPAPVAPVAAAPVAPVAAAPVAVVPSTQPNSKVSIERYLQQTVELTASDLHVKAGAPPTVRQGGHLKTLAEDKLVPAECDEMAMALLGDKELLTLNEYGEVDFAYTQPGIGRFRVNVHRHRGSLGIAARRILDNVPEFGDLLLPPAVEKLASEHRGLLLVTGPTSSGKTTTCGAIIRHINKTRACHIVTIEDPIEILHDDEQSVVTQREVGDDTKSFDRALRAAMRQDPDVIFVGEIRDLETMQAALQAAETGHMVIATLHTTDAVETINRIVDFFPPFQHNQVRSALAASLLGVVTQRLLPKIGGGRVPAIEIMLMTGRIKDCVLDADKTLEIHDLIAESNYYGMQTFDQSLVGLYKDGHATLEDASAAAMSPHDFQLVLKKAGVLDT